MNVAILAYGSLIDDPGDEIAKLEIERRSGIRTPFRVEFARRSSGRDGAPTLIPVTRGGACVDATVIVLRENTTLATARDVVYRREIHLVGDTSVSYAPLDRKNQVYVEELPDWGGFDYVLYTKIDQSIADPKPDELAEFAISSARSTSGEKKRDGITYLKRAIDAGIRTPLSEPYRDAILESTGASDLEGAWRRCRSTGDNTGQPSNPR